MLENGAKLDLQTNEGATVLMVAFLSGNDEIAKVLVDPGTEQGDGGVARCFSVGLGLGVGIFRPF